jgi:hypothetical protein
LCLFHEDIEDDNGIVIHPIENTESARIIVDPHRPPMTGIGLE